MFKDVWRWAGQYRRSDKNIGVAYEQIGVEVFKLCADAQYWIDHETYDWKELGARFHHKLVSIHPFPNGNGRHARLMTDVLMLSYEQKLFSWGADSKTREQYLEALREADRGRIAKLIAFAI
jgi:Fic-DOC domain mobile mystery protein B